MTAESWPRLSVAELQKRGWLLVEDGNHGEVRPRRDEFGEGEHAFIRAADIDDGRVLFDSAQHISSVARGRIRKGIGRPGDVLFSHKGTVGKLALVPETAPPFVCSPQTTFWRTLDEEELDRRYLYYFMQSEAFRDQWWTRKRETDMADYVSLTTQRSFFVEVPPIEVQRSIAHVLGAFDDKIDHNRELAKKVTHLAEGLFRAWLVAFEPVTARLRGAPRPSYCSEQTYERLPQDLPVTERMPETWALVPLTDIAEFRNGLALQKFPPRGRGDDLPVLKIAQLRRGTFSGADLAGPDVPDDYVIDDGEIIFSWSGTLDARVWLGGRGALNQHLFRVLPKPGYPIWFCLLWIRENLPWFRTIAASKATTMGHIRRSHLAEATAVVPSSEVLTEIDALVAPLFDLHRHALLESRLLRHMRDSLLPILMAPSADGEQLTA